MKNTRTRVVRIVERGDEKYEKSKAEGTRGVVGNEREKDRQAFAGLFFCVFASWKETTESFFYLLLSRVVVIVIARPTRSARTHRQTDRQTDK